MMGYLISLLIAIGIVLPIILLVETFKMFNNIKDIKDLLIEINQNQKKD